MENKRRIILLSLFGGLLIFLGLFLMLYSPHVISKLVNEKLAILPTNPGYKLWRDMDIPIYQNFYMFNITNPEEMKSGAKPVLKEIGPFVYKVNISKSALHFGQNNKVITFLEMKQFHFQPNLSTKSYDLNSSITTLNLPLLTVFKMINSKVSPWIQPIIKMLLNRFKYDLFVTGTVDELLFKGKYSKLQCLIHKIDPKLVPDCEFCLMKDQNNSINGPYKIYTGYKDINLLNTIIAYEDSTKLDFWSGDACNEVSGTSNGELFPPAGLFGYRKQYKFFRPDFCRVFNLTLSKVDILSEVDSLRIDRFVPDPKSFLNASQYPPNACYRPNPNIGNKTNVDNHFIKTFFDFFNETILPEHFKGNRKNSSENNLNDDDYEKPSGVFDIAPCMQNAPIYLSYPHFLDADESYLQQLIGLKPNRSIHKSYVDIEPKTGTPVDFIARIQANVALKTDGTRFPNMRSLMMPLMWQEFSIHITQEIASTIESQTKTPGVIAYSLSTLILVIGLAMAIYSLIILFLNWHQQRQGMLDDTNDPLINNETTPIVDNNNSNSTEIRNTNSETT